MKMHNVRSYLLLAASTFNALIALTILSAQPQEPLVSVTKEELMPSKREYKKNIKEKDTPMHRTAAPEKVIEILTLDIKPGRRDEFGELYVSKALPLLRKWNFKVLAYGPSLHDADSYYVIRSFKSLEDRQASEDAYYSSDDWKEGPRSAVLGLVDHFAYAVVSAETLKKATIADPDFTTIKGASDFDFFIGDWRVHHRRLKERLARNNDWEEFEGTSVARKILDGLGNMDENVIQLPSGTYRAATIRTFDAAKQLWTIWWIDSRNPGHLDPPVLGRFENGVGTFYADDQFKGRPIRVRYLWNQSASPHWEQAFSEDGGKTWETNWTMDFTRTQ
jgi:hypothetical protein